MIIIINEVISKEKSLISKMLSNSIQNSMLYDTKEVDIMLKKIITSDNLVLSKENNICDYVDIWVKTVINIGKELVEKYKKNLIISINLENIKYFKGICQEFSSIYNEVYSFYLIESDPINKKTLSEDTEIDFNNINKTKEEFYNEYLYTDNLEVKEVEKIILEEIRKKSENFFINKFLVNKDYYIKAPKLDLNLLNSSHQSVKQIIKKKQYMEVGLEIHPLLIQQQLDIEDLNKYLIPTKSIQSNSKEIINFINKNIEEVNDSFKIIESVLKYTRNIKFDSDLEIKIFNEGVTQDAIETIRRGKGTCCECVNVFIAIMRTFKIPSKFIVGKNSDNLYHFWAEVFVENLGWIPVETNINIPININKGYFGITNSHIKTHEGIDFESIDIKLHDLNIEIKKIE
ncbi:transglutaminase-like domain-containing protein [Clostridium carnis]